LLDKAASGAAITHDVHKETSDKITHIQVDNKMRMLKAATLGKHPSTLTYGFTVEKFNATELNTLDSTHLHLRASKVDKPFQLFSKKNDSTTMTFAEKSGATVDKTTGAFKTGAKAATIVGDQVDTHSAGEDVAAFEFNQTNVNNDAAVLATDTTSKSE
jgi:hypothetical protein